MKTMNRRAALRRRTRGTEVEIDLRLDGAGGSEVQSPFEFLSTLLEMMAGHGGMDLRLAQKMNHHADEEYAIDDLAMSLAESLRRCLGPRPPVRQFGSEILPVGDALVLVAVDLVSPPVFQFDATFREKELDGMSVELLTRFLSKLVDRLGASVHVKVLSGNHDANKMRAIFLALGRAIGNACQPADRDGAREVAANIDYFETARKSEGLGQPRRTDTTFEEFPDPDDDPDAELEPSAPSGRSRQRRGRGGRDRERPRNDASAAVASGAEDRSESRGSIAGEPTRDQDRDERDGGAEGPDSGRVRRRRGRRGGRGRRRAEGSADAGTAGGRDDGARGDAGTGSVDGAIDSRLRHADRVHSEDVIEEFGTLVEGASSGTGRPERSGPEMDVQPEAQPTEPTAGIELDEADGNRSPETGDRGSSRRGRSSMRGGRGRGRRPRDDAHSPAPVENRAATGEESSSVSPNGAGSPSTPPVSGHDGPMAERADSQPEHEAPEMSGASALGHGATGTDGAEGGQILDYVTNQTATESAKPAKKPPHRPRMGRRLPRSPRRRR